MKYDIKVNKLKNDEWSTKAFVSIIINDCFKVNGISIRETKEGKVFVAMPGYKTNQKDENGYTVYKNYCYPTTAEFRKELFDNIMKAYAGNGEFTANSKDTKLNYGVKLFECNSNSKIESIGRIKFDECFVIDCVKVIDSNNGVFVSMPSKTSTGADGKNEYTEICYPVTKEFREQLYTSIIKSNSDLKNKNIKEFEKVSHEAEKMSENECLPFR